MVNVLLTKKQTAMLSDLFDVADFNSEIGKHGMITGQFFRSDEGEGFFQAWWIDHDKSKALLNTMGMSEKTTDGGCEVYTDIE